MEKVPRLGFVYVLSTRVGFVSPPVPPKNRWADARSTPADPASEDGSGAGLHLLPHGPIGQVIRVEAFVVLVGRAGDRIIFCRPLLGCARRRFGGDCCSADRFDFFSESLGLVWYRLWEQAEDFQCHEVEVGVVERLVLWRCEVDALLLMFRAFALHELFKGALSSGLLS